jgi:hypothetical protein
MSGTAHTKDKQPQKHSVGPSVQRPKTKRPHAPDTLMTQLEILVDELIKNAPHESRVRTCMEAAGLTYSVDPIARMNTVLEALDGIRSPQKPRRREIEEQA